MFTKFLVKLSYFIFSILLTSYLYVLLYEQTFVTSVACRELHCIDYSISYLNIFGYDTVNVFLWTVKNIYV